MLFNLKRGINKMYMKKKPDWRWKEGFTLPHKYHWTPCTLSTLYWEFSGTAQGLSVHFQEMRLVPESPCTLYMDFIRTLQGLYSQTIEREVDVESMYTPCKVHVHC